jgi:hypothetical protein
LISEDGLRAAIERTKQILLMPGLPEQMLSKLRDALPVVECYRADMTTQNGGGGGADAATGGDAAVLAPTVCSTLNIAGRADGVAEQQRSRVRNWLSTCGDLHDTFTRLDVNRDGFVSKTELSALSRTGEVHSSTASGGEDTITPCCMQYSPLTT